MMKLSGFPAHGAGLPHLGESQPPATLTRCDNGPGLTTLIVNAHSDATACPDLIRQGNCER